MPDSILTSLATGSIIATETDELPPAYKPAGKRIIEPRYAAAETAAAAALVLTQHPATWECLHAAALAAEAGDERAALAALRTLISDPIQASHAVTYLEITDYAARAWAQIAHGPRAAHPIQPPASITEPVGPTTPSETC